MWQRYRSAVGTAFLTSAVIGVLIGVGIFLFGNPDYREQSGWGGLLYSVSLAAGVCVVTAGSAVLGGLLALMLRDRELTRPTEQRVNIAGGGAVIGAATLWLIVGGVAAATGTAGAIGLFGFLAVIAALATWFPAAIALDRAEQGSLRTKRAENE